MNSSNLFLILFFVFVSFGFVSAQLNVPNNLPGDVFSASGTVVNDRNGFSGDFLNDFSGDGYLELFSGAPGAGSVHLFDGRTAAIINSYNPGFASGLAGYRVKNIGDLNNNGFSDILTSHPNSNNLAGAIQTGAVYAYDSVGGQLILPYPIFGGAAYDNFGNSIDVIGDVNNDGINDFVVGAPGFNAPGVLSAGAVYVYSGASATLIYTTVGTIAAGRLGESVAGLGDVTGDGVSDFAASEPIAFQGSPGTVYFYSGSNGAVISSVSSPTSVSGFGSYISNIGDYNGDGINDLAINEPSLTGTVYIYSGFNLAQIAVFNGPNSGENFGFSIDGGDVNADGISDLIVGAPLADKIYVYRGGSGGLLYTWQGPSGSNVGTSVASADYNLDGFDEMLSGYSYFFSGTGTGPGMVVADTYGGVWSYGFGTLIATWTPATNLLTNPASGTVTVSGASANSAGFILCNSAPTNIQINAGNNLYVDLNPSPYYAFIPIQFNSFGSWTSPLLGLQNTAGSAGFDEFCQVIEYNGGSVQTIMASNRIHLTLVA